MPRVVNNHTQPVSLDDGTVLAAAGTDGSEQTVESISDRDRRRYSERGLIAVLPDAGRAPALQPQPQPQPPSEEPAALTDKRRSGK